MESMNPAEKLMHTFLTDVVGNGNLSLIEKLAQPDMADEANLLFGGPKGRDGLLAHVKGFRKNIVNPSVSIHRIIGNDAEVMAWWSFEGVHAGPWMNLDPTNDAITATVFSFFTLEQTRIKRYQLWLHADVHPPRVFDGRLDSKL